jgi:uncharacterized membrane protein (DUF485 family)
MSAPEDPSPAPAAAPGGASPLRLAEKPAHENDPHVTHWNVIYHDTDFKGLLVAKMRFILPATIFFLVYYFALPVLVGWCPDLMKKKIGSVNLAYLFALSQFFMAWIVAGFYVVKAARWDGIAAGLIAKFKR